MTKASEFFRSRDFKVGAGSAAGALALVFMLSGGEPVPEETVQIDLPKVDTLLADELNSMEARQLRHDMLRCGADFTLSVKVDDGKYSVDYDTSVGQHSRPCMKELEEARITNQANDDAVAPEVYSPE